MGSEVGRVISIPPAQNPQGPESIHPSRFTHGFRVKEGSPRPIGSLIPPTVLFSLLQQSIDGILHAGIGGAVTGLKIIQNSQKVIAPSGREIDARHFFIDDLPRAVGFVETME